MKGERAVFTYEGTSYDITVTGRLVDWYPVSMMLGTEDQQFMAAVGLTIQTQRLAQTRT